MDLWLPIIIRKSGVLDVGRGKCRRFPVDHWRSVIRCQREIVLSHIHLTLCHSQPTVVGPGHSTKIVSQKRAVHLSPAYPERRVFKPNKSKASARFPPRLRSVRRELKGGRRLLPGPNGSATAYRGPQDIRTIRLDARFFSPGRYAIRVTKVSPMFRK